MSKFDMPNAGIQCVRCNAELKSVYRTRKSQGFIIRERICESCGEVNKTCERIVHGNRGSGRYFN